jgi:hypothetical protein
MSQGMRFAMRMMLAALVSLAFVLAAYGADNDVQVEMDSRNAGPRAMEPLSERGIQRDYRSAWASIAQALEFNTLDPLDGSFAGSAEKWLKDTVLSQQRSGLSQRYTDQNHKVETVFYSPEGDVMELHDTAEYQLQILHGGKAIHDEHVVMHYVVLMTPAADRWVVRQLQAVPHF